MKYGSIKGWATDKGHVGWIPVESLTYGPAGAKGTTIQEFQISRYHDGSSAALWKESLNGKGGAVTIDFVDKEGNVYLTLKLDETMVSSFLVSGRGDRPTESLSLNFSKVTFSYGTPDDLPDAGNLGHEKLHSM
ncbi:MAG TPA: type VI secretion system tube protein Hcp [Bryobacteraceae bacterium]|nr:type VI secretion system tube protein Hcp [Bryobacteraceae bacterium]